MSLFHTGEAGEKKKTHNDRKWILFHTLIIKSNTEIENT